MDAVAGVASGVVGKFKGMLGIHSPSRVFAQFGDFTMQGLAGGLDRSQGEPLSQVATLGDRMKQAGAGIALGAAALPVMASAGPVVAPGAAQAATGAAGGNSYTIQITAAPGSDGQAIADLVRQTIETIERERASRRGSRLSD